MRLGLFFMPLHPAERPPSQTLQEDREAVILADQLGFREAFVGEHFSSWSERITVDSGHVVAFGGSVTSQIRKVATGLVQTMKSGEGLVFDFTGPGWVMTQTRNPAALEAWIRALMPGETGGASGGLGGLFGR